MSEPLEPNSQPSMFSVEDFPVSRTPSPVAVLPPQTSATSGPSLGDSFASLNPDGSWRKTCQGFSQVTLDGSLETFSEIWPRAGMTRNGTAYLRPPSAPLIDAIESGSLPTPTVGDSKSARNATATRHKIPPTGIHAGVTLTDHVTLWPTPQTAYDGRTDEAWRTAKARAQEKHASGAYGKGTGAPGMMDLQRAVRLNRLPTPTAVTDTGGAAMCKWGGSGARARLREMFTETELNGALNPTWVEWLMGYPPEWTVCEGLGTRSSRR